MSKNMHLDVGPPSDVGMKTKNKYPNLCNIAMRFLIIPDTSAYSERIFSTAGYILNFKRSRLSGNHAKIIIFLNTNL